MERERSLDLSRVESNYENDIMHDFSLHFIPKNFRDLCNKLMNDVVIRYTTQRCQQLTKLLCVFM